MKVEIINCAMNGQTIQRNLKILGRGNIENNQGVRSKTCSRNQLINEVGKERWYHGWYIFLLRVTTWTMTKRTVSIWIGILCCPINLTKI